MKITNIVVLTAILTIVSLTVIIGGLLLLAILFLIQNR